MSHGGIEYRVFYGDPGQKEVWQALDDFLSKTWSYSNVDKLGLACTCIDSAGHFTDEVYKFCKPCSRRNIFVIIGRGWEGMTSVSNPSRNNRRHAVLFTLGVTTIKGTLFSRLKVENHGADYCNFPLDSKHNHRGYDVVYFKSLLSERMVVKRVKGRDTITWEPRSVGICNEPLDTRVYATGALELFNPNFETHRIRRSRKSENTSMPKLKQPVYEEKPVEIKPPEVKLPEKKAVVNSKVSTEFFRRGLRIMNNII